MNNPGNNGLNLFSNETFKLILDNLNIPLAAAGTDNVIIWTNKAAEKLFSSSLTGIDFIKHFDLDQNIITEVTHPLLKSTNTLLTITPLINEGNEKVFLLAFTGESPVAQEDNFRTAQNLAHDLNNIFTNILNSVELIKQKSSEPLKQLSLLNTIESNSIRAAEIIEDVLVKEHQDTYTKRKINLDSLATEFINNIKTTLSVNIALVGNTGNSIKPIYGKYSDIYRVLMNLFINAKESIHGDGKIIIETSQTTLSEKESSHLKIPTGEYASIVVKDTGEGIDAGYINKIFSADFSTKNKKHKSGLGLNIVKEIIEKHGGSISVKSERGKGTEFTLLFPAIIKSIPHDENKKEKTILVAEDEYTLRELLVELLESYNYKVITAVNGIETIAKIKSGVDIDLMIIDKKMPELNGTECIKKIRELNCGIPVILASGSPTDEKDKLINQLKIDKVINKPYDFDYLLSKIEELIG